MQTIFKYEVALLPNSKMQMPADAKILSVGVQNDKICVWAMVDKEHHYYKNVGFSVIATGQPYRNHDYTFIGTVTTHGDNLVWHVFYKDQVTG